MRKRPQNGLAQSPEEIIRELRDTEDVLLHTDSLPMRSAPTRNDRLRLLHEYSKLKSAEGWYAKHGYPGVLGKDYKKGQRIRPEEVYPNIQGSAESISALLLLRKTCKSGLSNKLPRLKEVEQTNHSLELNIELAQDPVEKQAKVNRKIDRERIDAKVLEEKRKKLPYLKGQPAVSGDLYRASNCSTSTIQYYFEGLDVAWFSDHAFTFQLLPRLSVGAGMDVSDEVKLNYAEQTLIQAANIMLRGIQPELEKRESGSLKFQYGMRCDWHIIATAFAEWLSDSTLDIRECISCGKFIGDMKSSAKKCRDCRPW